MIHDVIVVGSGPSGAVAAATLASQGRSVLLVDQHTFPREKVCGDGMPTSVARMLTHHLHIDLRSFPHYRIAAINITAPDGQALKVRQADGAYYSFTAPRYHFDAVLHQHAVCAGAHFEVMHIEAPLISASGQVVGVVERRGQSRIEHEARVVIGADGASSAVARGLRGRVAEPNETAIAIRAYGTVSKPLEHCIYMIFQKYLLPGYGWVFPVGEHRVNVGVGLLNQSMYHQKRERLQTLLDRFLVDIRPKFPIQVEAETTKSWPIPCWFTAESRVVKGAYLVGDAGRNADPLTGGGVYPAMLTGLLAAEAAGGILDGTDPTEAAQTFNRGCNRLINRDLLKSLYMRRFITSHSGVFNGLMDAATIIPPLRKTFLGGLAGQHT